jgi:lipoate-protein ligase A
MGPVFTFSSPARGWTLEFADEGPALSWRVLRDPPASGAWNMALDEALARTRGPGEGVLRFYQWTHPTLSYGRHQQIPGGYAPAALRAHGVDAVRRPTGGREVLHDRELTYAVVVPARWGGGGPGAPRAIYRSINEVLVQALSTFGVQAQLAGSHHRPLHPEAGACFGAPAPDEVEAGGGKLVGSAQRRFGATLLQHGSILLDAPSVALDDLRRPGAETGASGGDAGASAGTEPRAPAVSLQALLVSPPTLAQLSQAIEDAFASAFGGRWSHETPRPETTLQAQALLAEAAPPLFEDGEIQSQRVSIS